MLAPMKLIFASLLFLSVAEAATCDFLKSDKSVQMVREFIHTNSDMSSYWPSYNIADKNYLFTKLEKSKRCAILITHQTEKIISTDSDIAIENGIFSFRNALNKFEHTELEEKVASEAQDGVLLLDLSDLKYHYPEAPASELAKLSMEEFMLNFLLHEGFHLFVDIEKKAPFKEWSKRRYFNRDDLERCYSDVSVQSVFKDEMAALKEAFLASAAGDITITKTKLQNFYNLRGKRYKVLGDFTLKASTGLEEYDISCALAEEHMELMEGSAEYFGNTVLIDEKVLSVEEAATKFTDGTDPFYAIGFAKYFALKKFMGTRFVEEIRKMHVSENDKENLDRLVINEFGLKAE